MGLSGFAFVQVAETVMTFWNGPGQSLGNPV